VIPDGVRSSWREMFDSLQPLTVGVGEDEKGLVVVDRQAVLLDAARRCVCRPRLVGMLREARR
jgi:hypothetical protein